MMDRSGDGEPPFFVIENGSTPPENDPTDAAERNEENASSGANDEALLIRIAHLEQDHIDLGRAIDALAAQPHHDRLSVARLKKKKLQLKDKIETLKNSLTPDIIA